MSSTATKSKTWVEASRRVIEIEEEVVPFRHCFDGFCVWSLFRIAAVRGLVQTDALPQGREKTVGRWQQLVRACRDMAAWSRAPRRVEALVVSYPSSRSEHFDGKWKDIFFDDIIREFKSAYCVERLDTEKFIRGNKEVMRPSDMTDTWITSFIRYERRLKIRAVCPAIIQVALELHHDLVHTEVGHLPWCTVNAIAQRLLEFRRERLLWKALVRRIGASMVFLLASPYEQSLIMGARDAGAKVCELQHGDFLAGGIEFLWPRASLEYRACLALPDRFFLYGNYWKDILRPDGIWVERSRVVGSPRMDGHRRAGKSRPKKATSAEHLLLVTLQGITPPLVARFLRKVLKLAEEWHGLRIVVKLHLIYDPNPEVYKLELAGERRVEIVPATSPDSTFDWLARADSHASISSTCHYEAIGMGVPTYILPFPSHEQVMHLAHRRHAVLITSESHLLKCLRASVNQSLESTAQNYYFRPGAIQSIREEIELLREDVSLTKIES